MPFSIIRNDITKVKADAIVNTANPKPKIGSGTDSAIYHAAGEEELLKARKAIGDIAPGHAAVTPAFDLDAKYIIHTVGPAWIDGEHGEQEILRSCYEECLRLAQERDCESVAFPLISSGVYGFPKDLAISTATSVIYDFLMHHDMTVYLVVFDSKAFDLSGKLFKDVEAYIDENYVEEKRADEYRFLSVSPNGRDDVRLRRLRQQQAMQELADKKYVTLDEHMKSQGKSFTDCLFDMMNESGMTNPEIYKNANISKQTFSKILSGEIKTPKKHTICALAIGMHLDLNKTNQLLNSAGYVLSKGSLFDVMIEYFIMTKEYNITKINIALYDKGLQQL